MKRLFNYLFGRKASGLPPLSRSPYWDDRSQYILDKGIKDHPLKKEAFYVWQ